MNPRKTIRAAALWGSLTGLTVGGVAGCYHGGEHSLKDQHAEIPKGAMPSENGAFAHEFMYRQAAKAERDDFVMYEYEFRLDTAELGPFGRQHLATIYKRLEAEAPFGILIQASDEPKLDEARAKTVVDILAQLGVPDPGSVVRVGIPAAEGLYGEEAQRAFGRLLQGNQGFGGVGGFGSGFGGLGGFGNIGGFGGFGGIGGGFGGGGFYR
jgi:hypothetical protein